jgi:transcriptional regulator with XRE-family HTH domain
MSRMKKPKSQYRKEFLARTKLARMSTGLSQGEFANLLGMKQDRYKQYETRTLLPHYLIVDFCEKCGVSEEWLISGRGPSPISRPQAASEAA